MGALITVETANALVVILPHDCDGVTVTLPPEFPLGLTIILLLVVVPLEVQPTGKVQV